MDNTKNALAELAVQLEVEAKFAQENGRNGRPIYNASRIIAELAKVPFDAEGAASSNESWIAVTNSRAITEEGDGK